MNRFKDIIDDLSKRRSDLLAKGVPQPEIEESPADGREKEPRLRLPYSSDPEPIGEPWAD
jgi:hypothetical protein